ncbi:MAG: VWA domain-containing protein [Clostridiales bacterium]|nr:VWA domain-containing protein [Clostridiales bacterium]
MKINPIIPIWLMAIICVGMLLLRRRGVWNYIRQILIVVLLFAMNLRIMVFSHDVEKRELNVDVLLVIDNSMSMLAEDFDGEGRRIDAVKEDCEYIIDMMQGCRFSVISFGNQAYRLAPYTSDKDVLMSVIKSLEGQTQYYAQGTSLNQPFPIMLEALKKDHEQNEDRVQLVYYFSDGEITSQKEKLGSYSDAKKYVVSGAVLGYGTEEGGRMKVKAYEGDDAGVRSYMKTRDSNGKRVDAVSHIDEDNLQSIADDLGIDYYHVEKSTTLRDVLSDINDFLDEYASEGKTGVEGYVDTYYWFAIPIAAILVFDLIYYKRRVRE